MLYDSVESLVGHTPLVRLSRAAGGAAPVGYGAAYGGGYGGGPVDARGGK